MMHFVPPSRPVRTRQGSNLKPALGEVSPETRHLNLRWSVARLDELRTALSDPRAWPDGVAFLFDATVAEITQLAHELAIPVRHPHP